MWCLFAFHYDVAYCAEPMVCYRRHEMSMTNELMENDIASCYSDDIKIPWAMKKMMQEAGSKPLVKESLRSVAQEYAHRIAGKKYKAADRWVGLTLEQFEQSLAQNTSDPGEQRQVRAWVYAGIADRYFSQGNLTSAREFYRKGLGQDPTMGRAWLKWLLLLCGQPGVEFRRQLPRLRQIF